MSEEVVTIDLPEDHYTIFKATRDNRPEVIVVNDALLAFRHTQIFPWHLRCDWRLDCVHDPEIAHAALQALIDVGNHRRHWEYEMSHDPQWNEAGWIFRLFSNCAHSNNRFESAR